MKKNEKKMALFSGLLILSVVISLIRGITQSGSGSYEAGIANRVLILDLVGTLSFATARPLMEALEEAESNAGIKAVILNINSPGGTVGSSQEVYRALMRLREKGVLIVSCMGDMAASGGYYVASASHEIFANPGTLTGSIGVIIPGLNFSELLKKLGVQSLAIKSGKLKDALSPFKPVDREDLAYMQQLVMSSYERFIQDILSGRKDKITEDQLRKVADGRVMTGDQALSAGLIDQIGGISDAKKFLKDTLKNPNLQFIAPSKPLFKGMMEELLKNRQDLTLLENLKIPLMYFYGGGMQ